MPIIAIGDGIYLERTQEIFPASDLAKVMLTEPRSIVACHNAGTMLKELDLVFTDHPLWQFKVTPKVPAWEHDPPRRRVKYPDATVGFWGFKRAHGRSSSRYFYPLDPLTFMGQTANRLYPNVPTWRALLEWATDIRDFCQENDLAVKPSAGGISGQLLRDPRFYPSARRKVPQATNEKVRPNLPGNFYKLYTQEGKSHRAYYLDQNGAHHTIASELDLPNSDTLFAKGYFRNPDDTRIWAREDTPRYRQILSEHGMLRVKVWCPYMKKTSFHPPALDKPGYHYRVIFTNEIPDLLHYGARIEGIIAAWTSRNTDTGLSQYAQWALSELHHTPSHRKPWLKPALLSAYGLLAARPRKTEFGFHRAKNAERGYVLMGGRQLEVMIKRISKERESGIVNVIHRAMIEAETRMRSQRLARFLHSHKCTVLAIYADSVFVDSESQLPFLPSEWKVSAELDRLVFLNSVSFTSKQLTKLPGIPDRDVRERLERLQAIRAARGMGKKKPQFAGCSPGSVRRE